MIPASPVTTERSTIPPLLLRVGGRGYDELLLTIPRLPLMFPFAKPSDETFIAFDMPNWAIAVSVLLPMIYDFVFVATAGTTPGKALFGTVVRRADDGGRLSLHQVAIRAVVPVIGPAVGLLVPASMPELGLLPTLLTPIVFLSVMWDVRRRGLHDKAAGSVVLRSSALAPG